MGLYLTKRLTEAIKEKYSWVGDIRGNGLFQGIEIIHERRSESDELRAYPELTKFLVDHLRYFDHLVLLSFICTFCFYPLSLSFSFFPLSPIILPLCPCACPADTIASS